MFNISALYKFHKIDDPYETHNNIRKELKKLSIKGTILVGKEGINGTISSEGSYNLEKAIQFLRSIEGFDNIDVKYSSSEINPFTRLKIKHKNEIVTIGDNSINPNEISGDYINANEWNELISDDEVILIDTRNNYECSIGTFENAINPKTSKFREFPKWVESQKFSEEDKKKKKVAMFCTGGIRCEKASSLMKKNGFKNVFHLKGGILKYLESINKDESMWMGECFVFDDRVSINKNLKKGKYEQCYGCRHPITKEDIKSKHYRKGISCPNCIYWRTRSQRNRLEMRQKQIELAEAKGVNHTFKRIRIDENSIERDIKNYYKSKDKKYEFNLSEIEIDFEKDINSKRKEILKYIKKFGFKVAANKYSKSDTSKYGGEIGWIKSSRLTKKIEKKLSLMKISEISEPIQTANGYLFLKLNNKREIKEKLNLEKELKQQVKYEKNRQLNQFSLNYYKKLKKNTNIYENK